MSSQERSEVDAIVSAMREFEASPELQAQAHTNLPGVLDRLKLRGVARQAVATGITMGLAGFALAAPTSWWAG